ncbi:stam-1 [Pristionchus pacificus]|uniref:Stam-1 n=1 Tax=Pristionchus pacificus TaxID=54126 RepID=A0A2A6B4I3_PRIPA|nr:stam-1 [Pristionchus pacificus]|eukprot:PDM60782.1 stam-1 [Pristionchus pacificus]
MSWLFDTSSPLDEIVEKATGEHQTTENWELILHICDAIKTDPKFVKPAITSLKKRLNHRDPHVVLLALSVLDSCWANSGALFRREISSREFINELESKCKSSVRQVGEKTRLMIKKWVDAEVKEDDSLSLVRTLYKTLAADGYSFESSEPKKRAIISNDPNVVTSQEEEDAIAKAIAASLSDAPKENGGSKSTSLYPSAMNGGASRNESLIYPSAPAASPSPQLLHSILKDTNTVTVSKDRAYPSLSMASTVCPRTIRFASPKKKNESRGEGPPPPPPSLWPILESESNETVKAAVYGCLCAPRLEKRAWALYDFEAAEDNELSFKTGDEMMITDDSNANWWRGRNERTRGEGLFPSSFVTMNPAEINAIKTETSIAQSTPVAAVVRIDEEQLLKCIALLEDCDPTGAVPDPPELAQIEASSLAQAPLIDAALASVDRQSNALAMVDVAIRNVLALYDGAVQQAAYAAPRYAPPPGQPMQQMQQAGHPQPAQPAASADWQQQQYMQQMQQQQQQQQVHQYAPPPPGQYPQYAPVPTGHETQQQY